MVCIVGIFQFFFVLEVEKFREFKIQFLNSLLLVIGYNMWRSRNFNFIFQFERFCSDLKGRFIICVIKINERVFILVIIYVLNDGDLVFFESFFRRLQDFYCDNIMLGGNLGKDKKGGFAKKIYIKVVNVVNEYVIKFDLVYIWRIFNFDILRYMWCSLLSIRLFFQ